MSEIANPLLNGEMDFNDKSIANTTTRGYRPTRLGQKLVQNGKFNGRGRIILALFVIAPQTINVLGIVRISIAITEVLTILRKI